MVPRKDRLPARGSVFHPTAPAARWFAALLLILLPLLCLAATPPTLVISEQNGGIMLSWTAPDGQVRWAVLRSNDPMMLQPDTLAITSNNWWFDLHGLSRSGLHWFYRVVPWYAGPTPDNFLVIEDFDSGDVNLTSYPGEDYDPDSVEMIQGGPDDSRYFLSMSGNTWKVQSIQPVGIDFNTVWSIDLYLQQLGRMQMIGIGDGEDEMFYVIWGEDAPNTDPWITTYEGWFPEGQWITVELPVGQDWHGRFGNYGPIDRIFYVNDNDYLEEPGVIYIDNLRDITDAQTLAPTASFDWNWGDPVGDDSIEVVFANMSRDDDSGSLAFLWSFGDGVTSTEEHPAHVYPRGGQWPVSLRATDRDHNWDIYNETVVDSPLTLQSDFTISCVGDIMIGRGYLSDGGYIDQYGIDYLFQNIEPYISAADLALCNLECPLTDATEHHPTKTIWFKGREEDAIGLANAGFDYATLANNHIFDYLVPGMHDTQDALDAVGVLWGGAGDNDIQARMPTYLSYGGKSLAVISMCNRTGHYNNYQPFLDSGRNRPGFALWNRTAIEATIPEAAEQADLVMAYVHCGSEYSRYPMDGDKDGIYFVDEVEQDDNFVTFELLPDSGEVALRHYAIDQGADLVVCHHPHIIQGVEIYNGKLIVHSLGNFIMDLSMNETMPTMIAEIHVGADSVDAAIIRPGWIEEWIPVIASGGFAKAILDYETHYSRLLNTQLVRLPGEEIAHILWDTTYARTTELSQGTFDLGFHELDDFRSRPFLLDGDGYITRVRATGLEGNVQIRYGRDILLWANMEDEGAQPWDLNSPNEFYDDTEAHGGERSIKMQVPDNAGDNYVTLFERRVRIYPDYPHSFLGWMKTNNAATAEYQVRFYQDRGGGDFNLQEIPASLNGANDWMPIYADFDDLAWNNRYINIRLSEYPAENGLAESWYDDMAFIWWEDWEDVDGLDGVDLPYPNGYRYAQVRSTQPGTASVTWTREWPADLNIWSGVLDENHVDR